MSEALIQTRGPGVLRKSAKVAPSNRFSFSQRENMLDVVDAAAERFHQVERIDAGVESLLGVADQEFFAEIGERRALLQSVIGRPSPRRRTRRRQSPRCRAANACRCAFAPGLIDLLEHAVGERRGARAAAGERQSDQHVVARGRIRAAGRERVLGLAVIG